MVQDCVLSTTFYSIADQVYHGRRELWTGYRSKNLSTAYFTWWNRYSWMESYTG